MRGGICTVQQALTPEATITVKQAVALAKRRGHAQVTPLHVASAMLATSAGLLRKACLQCHSHPLQCKALELCFNVALNRLPASGPGPLLGPPHHHRYPGPSFSNALVAAFKRAQAHQRRGSAENQQQPILALKIELEQLVISILDDPSVSRVMREAGFSSPVVKSRVELAVSLENTTTITSTSSKLLPSLNPNPNPSNNNNNKMLLFDGHDVNGVLTAMVTKRKSTVVVGESLAAAESVARGVIETGGQRYYLQFVNLPLFSLRNLSKEEADWKVIELRCVVKSYIGRGVVFYLGDLTWVSEFWSTRVGLGSSGTTSGYFALEQIIMELNRLVSNGENSNNRVWLMGISTFQSYVKCKTGNPSLEALWELQPVTIPVGISSLSLSLKFESDVECDVISRTNNKASKDIVISENHCSFDDDVDQKHIITNNNTNSSTISTLPSWLQKYREENNPNNSSKRISSNSHNHHHQEYCITVGDLCKKWNSFCSPGQKNPQFSEKPLIDLSSSQDLPNPNIESPKEYQFWALENNKNQDIDDDDDVAVKPELLSNPNSSPNSASSSEVVIEDDDDELGFQSFNELNPENLRILCDEMEKDVPWQREIVPEIATAVLQCRSGMSQRKGNFALKLHSDNNSWLAFLGADSRGKEKIARTLAKLVFGSQSNSFVSISLSDFSSKTDDENNNNNNKRTRDDRSGCGYVQRLGEAMNENPRRVFFLEDLEEVDRCSQKGIKRAIESGKINLPCGETVPLKDSIVIFSCDSGSGSGSCSGSGSGSGSRSSSPKRSSVIVKERYNQQVSLDLNISVVHEDHHGNDQEDDREEDSDSSFYVGILESVDKKFVFKVKEDQE